MFLEFSKNKITENPFTKIEATFKVLFHPLSFIYIVGLKPLFQIEISY